MAHDPPNPPRQPPRHEHPALYITATSSYRQQVEPRHLPPTRSASFDYTCQRSPPTSSFNLTTPSCYPSTIRAGIGPSFGPIIFSVGPITPPTVLQPSRRCWPPGLTTSTATSASAQCCRLTGKREHAHHNHHPSLIRTPRDRPQLLRHTMGKSHRHTMGCSRREPLHNRTGGI